MSVEKKETKIESLNIHKKLLKIAEAAGVLQRTKTGYNYKYVPEEEIQAKVTGAMQQYGVMLYNQILPGTLTITPRVYDRITTDRKGVTKTTHVNEVIVSAETLYTWVNVDNPDEKIEVPWIIIGQMEDASQAFGAANTYCNRYFLMKSLQLATTEADPDEYRSKQQESADYEKNKIAQEDQEALQVAIKKVVDAGSKLISLKIPRDTMYDVVSKHNGGDKDPTNIADISICEAILKEFSELSADAKKKPAAQKAKAKTPAKKEEQQEKQQSNDAEESKKE